MMEMKVLVTGSVAIDITGVYPGSFEAYERRYDVTRLNASFQLGELQTGFGGCCLNIAYGLRLLGVDTIPLSSAGRNFRDAYLPRLLSLGINADNIAIDDEAEHGASCLMINDEAGNQIIGFYPGRENPARRLPSEVPGITEVGCAILAPERAALMLRQARDLGRLGIPIVLDPGQAITDFEADEIVELLDLSSVLVANEHEFRALLANGKLSERDAISRTEKTVITRSEAGADIFEAGERRRVAALKDDGGIVDATGCGDAFRAGFVYGLAAGRGTETATQLGCVMAAINLHSPGTQNYVTDRDTVEARRREAYD